MTEEVLAPDERALRACLDGVAVQLGVDAGRWRVISLDWPDALIAVSAAPREGAPLEYALRFELTNYPEAAPTAVPWNVVENRISNEQERPKGGLVGLMFRTDWADCLYAPFDRLAVQKHGPDWANETPQLRWSSRRDLSFYLMQVWDALSEEEYVGV